MNVSHEIDLLVEEIQRLGSKNANGQTTVKFGVLFSDDRCANIFEALVGTLRAAKKKKVIDFNGELLLQGVHDNVDVVLLKEWDPTSFQITVSAALTGSRFYLKCHGPD